MTKITTVTEPIEQSFDIPTPEEVQTMGIHPGYYVHSEHDEYDHEYDERSSYDPEVDEVPCYDGFEEFDLKDWVPGPRSRQPAPTLTRGMQSVRHLLRTVGTVKTAIAASITYSVAIQMDAVVAPPGWHEFDDTIQSVPDYLSDHIRDLFPARSGG